uniref:Amine oxidase domain-containing protein n=1 Tax=Lotharella globosa TaxID=91324 RepID=A0A7S4DND3_9EUKA
MRVWPSPWAVLLRLLMRSSVRLRKKGGELVTKAKVDEIMVENGKIVGVRLQNGKEIRAKEAVVSATTVWDTVKLLKDEASPEVRKWKSQMDETPAQGTIAHLFLGIDGDLPLSPEGKQLDPAQLFVKDWNRPLSDPQNVVTVSIPTILDPTIAPKGKHIIHVYTAGTEPYDLWKSVDGDEEAYNNLKEERQKILWEAVERIIPDIRERVDVQIDGSPLTHAAFLHRHQGTYGPALPAGKRIFGILPEIPLHLYDTPVNGLYRCGDSTFPGPGVPAAVASGAIVANTLLPWYNHALKILRQSLGMKNNNRREGAPDIGIGHVLALLKESYFNRLTPAGAGAAGARPRGVAAAGPLSAAAAADVRRCA